jgi:hypothetical protein
MFMKLERVDTPAAHKPANPVAGDDCPHCQWTASISFVSGYEPYWTDHLQCCNCDSTYCIPNPEPAFSKQEVDTAIEKAKEYSKLFDGIPDSRFKLARFPDYEFQPDGTPVRTAVRMAGPEATTGVVKPSRVTSKSRYYSLASTDGRVTITSSRLASLIESSGQPADFFTIDDFPNAKFDVTGAAYSNKQSSPLDHKPLETANGTIRRYRLYSKSRNAYVWFTDAAARRYNDGRCSLTAAEVPEDCVRIGDEFPDFVVDVYSGQPYRVQSKRIAIYAPVKCSMRVDGKFHIQNYAGKRVLFTPKQLLNYVGVENGSESSSESGGR